MGKIYVVKEIGSSRYDDMMIYKLLWTQVLDKWDKTFNILKYDTK